MRYQQTESIYKSRTSYHQWLCTASIIVCFLFSVNCFSQNPVYKKYTVDDGLPSNEIYQITQDTQGYIWLATSKGASRFDGNRFENFTIENGLPDNEILMVIQDKQQRIWFKSFAGPMTYYDGMLHNSSNTPWLKNLEFKRFPIAFTPLDNGSVLICTNGQNIFVLKDSILKLSNSIFCTNIVQERDSSVLIISYDYLVENGKKIKTPYFNQKLFFTTYYNRPDDFLLAVSDSGMISYHQHKFRNVGNQQNMINNRGSCVLVCDKEGYFWMTDFNNLYRFKIDSNSMMTHIHKYFDGISINNIFEDKNHNFWFATKGEGLLMVPSLNIKMFNKTSGLDDNNITSAIRTADSEIVCGTLNGFIHTINKEDKIQKSVNLYSNKVLKIINDKNKGAYILTPKNLFYLKAASIKKLCPFSISNKSITIDAKDEVWLGGHVTISKYENGKLRTVRVGQGVFRLYSICEKTPGELWAGTEKGLFTWKDSSFLPFHHELKPFNGWIDDICKTREGKMLVTTRDSGLAIISDTKIDFINRKDGLQSNTCTSLCYDSISGTIYLGLDKGLSVISFDKNNVPKIKNYNPTNGLLCGSIFSISERNGEILLSTDHGLLVFSENNLNVNTESPKVYITKLEVNNSAVALKVNYNLNYNEHDLRILFDGISFRNAKSLEYRYQVTPLDKGWNSTFSNTVVYADLLPGAYKFTVQVRIGDGKWFYDNSSFTFTINKPYWATWWFKLSVLLIIIALIYIIYRYQLRKKLEQLLAINADRTRISSEMHDDLGSGLSKISLLSDMINRDTSGENMKPHLSTISRSSKEMVEVLGDIIWSMNVKNDQLSNLIAYTRKYAMEFFETTSVRCIVILPEAIPIVNIDGKARRNIFLVVKEALHNVLKHSAGDSVTMKFEISAHHFSILIHDNGKGIDPLKLSEFGNGLVNMGKRMKDTGGSFSIKNEEGTRVEILMPLKT